MAAVLTRAMLTRRANDGLKIGIIGGSAGGGRGILENRTELPSVQTPFGAPSGPVFAGSVGGVECVMLPRHGSRQQLIPSRVNYRANICALKLLGCTHIIACTACGSLREDYEPGHFVALTSFIDRTAGRQSTFFDGSEHAPPGRMHIPMDSPFCQHSTRLLCEAAQDIALPCHSENGVVVTIEGPRFSSQAESRMYRLWGADVLNMTSCPEIALAAEAGLPYAAIGMVTDYDCWRDSGGESGHVSVGSVRAVMKHSRIKLKELLAHAIPRFSTFEEWGAVKEAVQQRALSSGF